MTAAPPSRSAATAWDPAAADAVALRALTVATRTALGVLADPDAAADVAQDVALQAHRRASTLRDPAKLDAWLHRVAIRAALKEARRRRTRSAAERAAAPTGTTGGRHDDPTVAALHAAALLAGLPARQRAALTLRYVHDLDDAAIGRALGCRTGTVRSLLSRGLAQLRTTLTHEDTHV